MVKGSRGDMSTGRYFVYLQVNIVRYQYTLITSPIFPLLKAGERNGMQTLAYPCLTCTYTDIPEPSKRYRTAGSYLTAILHPPPLSLYHVGPTWLTANDHTFNT